MLSISKKPIKSDRNLLRMKSKFTLVTLIIIKQFK